MTHHKLLFVIIINQIMWVFVKLLCRYLHTIYIFQNVYHLLNTKDYFEYRIFIKAVLILHVINARTHRLVM